MIFGQLATAAVLVPKFNAGTRKLLNTPKRFSEPDLLILVEPQCFICVSFTYSCIHFDHHFPIPQTVFAANVTEQGYPDRSDQESYVNMQRNSPPVPPKRSSVKADPLYQNLPPKVPSQTGA